MQTTLDDFLGGALQLHQPANGYRAGLDAVLLAAACPANPGQRVLDCGAGVGTVGLSVVRRVAGVTVTLVERDAALAEIARRNVQENHLSKHCTVVTADLTARLSSLTELAGLTGQFDHTVANPPYYAHTQGTRAADTQKDGSHAMPEGAFDAWVRFAAAMTRDGGTLTVVHRVEALPELLAALGRRFGGATILPLHPRPAAPANRVLLQAVKSSRAPLTLLAGRSMHAVASHGFTAEFDAILRHGAPLAFR